MVGADANEKTGPDQTLDEDSIALVNARVWSQSDFVGDYLATELRAPEQRLFERYAQDLSGRVLELGCGAGRVTGHLIEVAASVEAIDISPAMVDHCRRTYPGATFSQGDLGDLSRFASDAFDAIVASFCVVDVLGDADRRRLLGEIARLLVPRGLLLVSSHNLDYASRIKQPINPLARTPLRTARNLLRMPRRVRNHRRLRRMQRIEGDHAILIDEAHDFSLLHYYIGRDAQANQFAQLGFEPCECLDMRGMPVAAGDRAAAHPELHYAARLRD